LIAQLALIVSWLAIIYLIPIRFFPLGIYPQLSRLAPAMLSISASSITSERIFSETGRILEARREKLNPDSLASLVFLRNFRWFLLFVVVCEWKILKNVRCLWKYSPGTGDRQRQSVRVRKLVPVQNSTGEFLGTSKDSYSENWLGMP
jgi:hypothetical protein